MLLGPLSETIKSVSARDCAFADEMTDGAAIPVAARAVVDFRNSRRFIEKLPRMICVSLGTLSAKDVPETKPGARIVAKRLIQVR